MVTTLANTVKFQSGAGSDVSASFPLGANGGAVLPYNAHGWFQSGANETLSANLSLISSTGIQALWVQAT